MNTPEYNDLRELSWRRQLNPVEQAEMDKYLAAHPEARAGWEADAQLNRVLEKLPDAAPVSSNFTARVLETLRREEAAAARDRSRGWFAWRNLGRWLPRLAAVGLVMTLGVLLWQRQESKAQADRARNLASLANVLSANPEVMANFEPISRLGAAQTTPDVELIALMQ